MARRKTERGDGYLYLRPDSGDPVETVLMALQRGTQVFGSEVNQGATRLSKGACVPGDGINIDVLRQILRSWRPVTAPRTWPLACKGLLQKVNRTP